MLTLLYELLEWLRLAYIFMKLDLCGIYKMVFLHEGDDAVTLETVTMNIWSCCLSYVIFQQPFSTFMNILQDMLHQFVIIYLDNILSFSDQPLLNQNDTMFLKD